MQIPIEQQNIRDRCFHPSGTFVEFEKEEVEQSIPARFEQIVRLFPDNVAVTTQHHELTYTQVNLLANRTAWLILRERPASSGRPLALLFENDAPLVTALIGALKTGHPCSILNPSDPPARIRHTLDCLDPELIVTNHRNFALASELQEGERGIVDVDNFPTGLPTENPNRHISPNATALILYTSGSTGEPKGIVLAHRTELRRTMILGNCLHLCPADRWALLASLTSAHGVGVICTTLLIGASVHYFDAKQSGLHGLAQWLVDRKITLFHIGVPTFRHFAETLKGDESFPSVRILRLSSDQARSQDIEVYRKHFSLECVLVHGFASTETGSVTFHFIDKAHSIIDGPVPLGFPLEGNEILLLDENHKEVDRGEVGNIAIKSRYGSLGYWRDPELTRAKFVADASGDEVLFLTGDQGLRSDQGIIYFGRTDARVKIRGFSVDATEIESALLEHTAVKEAVVTGVEDPIGERRLAAYVVPQDTSATPEGLRSFLSKRLPDHMIPTAFVIMDALPVSVAGKVDRQLLGNVQIHDDGVTRSEFLSDHLARVDRKALPNPDWTQRAIGTKVVRPRNQIEAAVARIWSEVLHVNEVGVYDSFFELGGHSLTAAHILSRVRDQFDVDLPLKGIFERPFVADMASMIAGAQGAESNSRYASIPVAPRDRELKLSFGQERLWFLEQLQPESCTYNLLSTFAITGRLNKEGLERAFNGILRRHEILRTVFRIIDGRPVQVVLPDLALSLPVIDVMGIDRERMQSEVAGLAVSLVQRPFRLDRGPLLRIILIRVASEEHVLCMAVHHAIFDLSSSVILFRELSILYEACCNMRPSPLPELSLQYADFAQWQRKQWQGDESDRVLMYWKKRFTPMPPVLQLPTDRTRPSIQSSSGGRISFVIGEDLLESLQKLSREKNVTLFMVLLTAYQTLLHRYTGQGDIVVGCPISERDYRETEKLIGFFLNTLPIRTEFSANATFSDLLERVKETCLGAFSNQQLPFERLVEELHPERNLSHNPLFQVSFSLALEDTARILAKLPGLELRELEIESGISRFDQVLFLVEKEKTLQGAFIYNKDLFDAETIRRMANHFSNLLCGIVARPGERISNLPILTQAERQRLLVEWNDTERDYPRGKCIHELFEEQVERTPDAVAVVFPSKSSGRDQQLTYRELNARANQLAHHLRGLGVGPEVRVGVLMERSGEMVVGLLGILKAGGAYVPLDPMYPQERLSFMMEDTGIALLLAESDRHHAIGNGPQGQSGIRYQRSEASSGEGCDCKPVFGRSSVRCDGVGAQTLIFLDDPAIAEAPTHDSKREFSPESVAYVDYTSGSTGRPKGVSIPHRCVSRLLFGVDYVQLNEAQTHLHLSPLSFDASTFEVWGPLLHGGKCVLYAERVPTPEDLAEALGRYEVSILWLTASLFNLVVDTRPDALGGVEQLLVGGEALSVGHVRRGLERFPTTQIVNGYGPTEGTTFTCCHRIPCELDESVSSISIGRPIGNTRVYLLDRELQAVPAGVVGELHIGGDGLARGYAGHGELTAEKFIPDPYGLELGARVYRTGDLTRYLADGNIEFVGRVDHQVKVRGFRIEPGEIEAVLAQHPAVLGTVVLAREPSRHGGPLTTGEKQLVGYVVPEDGGLLQVSELRRFLGEKLPNYMIPSAFVVLESLPLTLNGKVDRKALLEMDLGRPDLSGGFVSPQSRVEELLAGIWSGVLGIERVGVHDNFFELGGDSILSIRVVARANQAGLRLSPKQLFEHQTIAELTTVVDATPAIEAEQGLVTGTAPLTPIERWFFSQEPTDPHHFSMGASIEVQQPNPDFLRRVVEKLLSHHDALRMRFSRLDSDWRQVLAAHEENPVFLQVDLSALTRETQTRTMESVGEQLHATLNLFEGPLIRIALFDCGTQRESQLLVIIHHLVVDGVSWRILLEDLEQAYWQLRLGKPMQLAPKTTSFKYWATKLEEYAQSDAMMQELSYWAAESRGERSGIPVDYPGGANTEESARVVSVSLSARETRVLLEEVPGAYHTQINDVLLTALVEVLSNWTGKHSTLIDLEGHGREELFENVDLSRTVGWFTTIFPVRLEAGNVSGLSATLKSIKEQLRSVPNRGIGYGLLRYLSGENRIIERFEQLPKADVSFNYLGQFDQLLPKSSGLAWRGFDGPKRSSEGSRSHPLTINGSVSQGQLQMRFGFSANIHEHATIECVAQTFIESLRRLIEHCRRVDVECFTPSDFTMSNLSQKELDGLMAGVSQVGRKNGSVLRRRRNVDDLYVLSPMQQGMLFESLYARHSGVYCERRVYRLRGDFDALAFRGAWQRVVGRHPVMRTVFFWEALEEPHQLVQSEMELPFAQLDWRELSSSEQQDALEAFLTEDRDRGFELSKAPPLRLTLMQLAEREYFCVFSFHHILFDRWSLSLVFQQVFAFYNAFREGNDLRLGMNRPYRDYIAWLGRRDKGEAEDFWRRELKGFCAPTLLAVDRAPGESAPQEIVYERQRVELPEATTAVLQRLCREERITLNTLFQAAWAILLSRYSGEEDVVFGATMSGRPTTLPAVEEIVGLFINTLPVRVRFLPGEMVLPFLHRLQDQTTEWLQYDYSPLVEVQAWSDVPRGLRLFESILVFENIPASVSDWTDEHLEIDPVRSGGNRTNYPLVLTVAPGQRISVQLVYDSRRFDETTVQGMLSQYQTLFEGMVADPDQPVSDLSVLTEAERHQLLVEWNDTKSYFPKDICVHELFELQVKRTPDAVAVVFPSARSGQDEQVTYRELNARTNQLAHRLQKLGVRPEVLVGVLMEWSVEMVVGLLGILKAGGAYMPMDPTYPAERLALMLQDSAISLLLTQIAQKDRLHDLSKMARRNSECRIPRVVCLDTEWRSIAMESLESPPIRVTGENLVYVIYTSGSTGKPKGVGVCHRGFVNLLHWFGQTFTITCVDKALLMTSLSFDLTQKNLFVSLSRGGTLHLLSSGPYDPRRILNTVREQQITWLNCTPSGFYPLIEQGGAVFGQLGSVRNVFLGGEAISASRLARWMGWKGSHGRVVNTYGPTECTDVTAWFVIEEIERFRSQSVPIGRPVWNGQQYLLDRRVNLVPTALEGELGIGGEMLGRGYVTDAARTAEKFVPHPFGEGPGFRLYRTGDLGRYHEDGAIELQGRIDQQVKVRGFRLELGEVEAALRGHPEVREAVVVTRPTEDHRPETEHQSPKIDSMRLVAYVVARKKSSPGVSELRRFLQQKLPDYMIPQVFMVLDGLPLTPNGKVDRNELPEPEGGRPELAVVYVAPHTPTEKILAGIFGAVLGLEQVGVEDNFFELGGHSLLATQVVSRVRDAFEIDLPLRDLFEAPTIAGLAESIETIHWATTTGAASPDDNAEDVSF